MVRITFRPSPSDKIEKGDEEVIINQLNDLDDDTSPRNKKYFPVRLCIILISVLVVLLGLVLGSIYAYRHFFPVQLDDISVDGSAVHKLLRPTSSSDTTPVYGFLNNSEEFNCHVVLETMSRNLEMELKVAISVEDEFQFIRVLMIKDRGMADWASENPKIDIVHDFTNGKTAYYDKQTEQCYVTMLDKDVVKAPSNLLEVLTNTKKEIYFPNQHMLQDIQIMGEQLNDDKDLGSAIQEMCHNKKIFEMMPKEEGSSDFESDFLNTCNHFVHFENRYMVETYICSRKMANDY
ncbi:integral membrane protein 2Cb isoform X2 [Festucalex cinctus]